jgi:hypothetical protein
MIRNIAGSLAAGIIGVAILALVTASVLKTPKETCRGKNS